MTMVGAWFYKVLVCIMLWLLLSPNDNGRSMVLYSVVCTMLWLLLSPNDNGRSMVLYSVSIYHALAVVIA